MKTKITQQLIESIRQLTLAKMSNIEIANRLDIKLTTVNNIKSKYNIVSYRGLINDKEFIDYVKDNYLTEPFKVIAKKFNCSRCQVERLVRRLGLEYNQYLKVQKVKTNVFIPRTVEGDYWLGFLLADGYIHGKIELTLAFSDKEHLETFSKFTGAPIIDFKSYCRVVLFHKETVKYLQTLGFSNKKTFNGTLNLDCSYDILRGIIDGDGHITKNAVLIASSNPDIVAYITNFLNKENISYRVIKVSPENKKGLTRLHYTISISMVKNPTFFNKLYSESCVKLNRKYLKWVNRSAKTIINTVNSGKP